MCKPGCFALRVIFVTALHNGYQIVLITTSLQPSLVSSIGPLSRTVMRLTSNEEITGSTPVMGSFLIFFYFFYFLNFAAVSPVCVLLTVVAFLSMHACDSLFSRCANTWRMGFCCLSLEMFGAATFGGLQRISVYLGRQIVLCSIVHPYAGFRGAGNEEHPIKHRPRQDCISYRCDPRTLSWKLTVENARMQGFS